MLIVCQKLFYQRENVNRSERCRTTLTDVIATRCAAATVSIWLPKFNSTAAASTHIISLSHTHQSTASIFTGYTGWFGR